MKKISRTIELKGHIIESLILPKVYDEILDRGGDYEAEEVVIGKRARDASYARIRIDAPTEAVMEEILRRLRELGAIVREDKPVTLKASPKDGVFPDHFYSTTNLDTAIYLKGKWIEVGDLSMDCGIRMDEKSMTAVAAKMFDVKKGEQFVIGTEGVRVKAAPRPKKAGSFQFMSSGISSEKPKGALIRRIAEEMKKAKEEKGAKTLFVCGPAIVHTGARDYLTCLIEKGYVDILFAGNALAAHDIEASLYGTSLGVSLEKGISAPGGHNHHLRAINTIRAAGGIKAAVKKGILKDGIMHSCVTRNVPFLLAGSIRDDGPLPEVITDVIEAQRQMKKMLRGVSLAIMVSTMLHSIAAGNLLPADVRTICVDIDPAMVTKLSDRGTHQVSGMIVDVETFLRELCTLLP